MRTKTASQCMRITRSEPPARRQGQSANGPFERLLEPEAVTGKAASMDELACELMKLKDHGGNEDLREQESIDSVRADPASVKDRIEIPHNAVFIENGMLRSEPATTDFVKAMSHELRTPLNVIIGLCQLLERDRKSPLSSMQRDAVQRMERNARTLLGKVTQLLNHVKSGHFDSRS
jgi:signal transduction histidine kinase